MRFLSPVTRLHLAEFPPHKRGEEILSRSFRYLVILFLKSSTVIRNRSTVDLGLRELLKNFRNDRLRFNTLENHVLGIVTDILLVLERLIRIFSLGYLTITYLIRTCLTLLVGLFQDFLADFLTLLLTLLLLSSHDRLLGCVKKLSL